MQIAFTLPGVRNRRPPEAVPPLLNTESDLVTRHRRDWFRILAELQAAGFSNADVARALKLSDSTIRNWKYGIEPIHSKGEALLELHERIALGRRRPGVRARKRGNGGKRRRIGAVKAGVARAGATKAGAIKADVTKADVTKAGAIKADVTKAGAIKADVTKADLIKASAAKVEAAKASAGKRVLRSGEAQP